MSGRRRYALAFVVVGASLGVMGAQCQPPKAPPPPQSGLSISPTVGDFGSVPVGTGEEIQFTVTNHGPGDTGALDVQDPPGDPFDIVTAPSNDCQGTTLQKSDTCFVVVSFEPLAATGYLESLVVDDPSNGEVSATLGGVGT